MVQILIPTEPKHVRLESSCECVPRVRWRWSGVQLLLPSSEDLELLFYQMILDYTSSLYSHCTL